MVGAGAEKECFWGPIKWHCSMDARVGGKNGRERDEPSDIFFLYVTMICCWAKGWGKRE